MYSRVVDGKVKDLSFRKINRSDSVVMYNMFLGDEVYGQIFKLSNTSWTPVCYKKPFKMSVSGFRSRLDAAVFILDWTLLKEEN